MSTTYNHHIGNHRSKLEILFIVNVTRKPTLLNNDKICNKIISSRTRTNETNFVLTIDTNKAFLRRSSRR